MTEVSSTASADRSSVESANAAAPDDVTDRLATPRSDITPEDPAAAEARFRDYARATERPQAPPTPVDRDRRAAIDSFVAENADAQTRFGPLTLDSDGGERIGAALLGESDLGRLTSAEQDYLAEAAVARWSATRNHENAHEAAAAVLDDRHAARALAGAMADPVADIDRHQASGGTNIDLPGATEFRAHLRETAVGLDPAAAADAYEGAEELLGRHAVGMGNEARAGLLEAVAGRRINDEAADRLVTSMFVHADGATMADHAAPLADALAMIRHPGTDAAAGASRTLLADRLEEVLSTSGGRDLLANENVPPELRAWAFEKVATEPSWTADTLEGGWESDVVTTAFAEETAAKHAARGVDGQVLSDAALRNTVGTALGLSPDRLPPETESAAARDARLAAGLDHGYYSDASHAATVADMIERVGGDGARISAVPVTVTSNEFGATAMTVFRVDRADGSTAFVDAQGQKYDDLAHWQSKNELPEGRMAAPEGLRPGGDLSAPENTRAVVDTFGEHVGRIGDYAAIGVGVVAGVAIVVGTGGTAALVAAGAAGAYTAGRAGAELHDDHNRGVDVLDFSDAETRSRWLEVAAGTLSLGAIGAGVKVANAARQGVQVGAGFSRSVAALTIAADTADAAAMTDQAAQLATNWEALDNGQRAMGMLNVAFWGGMAAASTRAGGAALGDAFSFTRVDNTFRNGTPYPLETSAGMAPGEMRVAYDKGANGRAEHVRIETGPGPADPAALARHTDVARQIEAAGGLRDRFAALTNGKRPEIGTGAWEARLEIDKITAESEAIAAEMADPGLSTERLTELTTRQRELDQAITRESTRLDSAAAGSGFVAAPRSLDELLDHYSQPKPDGRPGDIARGVPDDLPALASPAADAARRMELGALNDLGQATGIEATITEDMLNTGSKADGGIRDLPGWKGGGANHSRGHLLARMLGGSGSDRRNLVTMYQLDTNSPVMRDFETAVYNAVEAGEVVNYRVTPLYDGAGMPYAVAMQARGSEGLEIEITILNRDGRE